MALGNFTHQVRWNEFRTVARRPGGEQEDAKIHVVLHNFLWSAAPPPQGEDYQVTSVNGSIRVVRARSWVVNGHATDVMLRHEQGHFDISAIGFRELHDVVAGLYGANVAAIRGEVRENQTHYNDQIRRVNLSYDQQTSHGTIAAAQTTWDARIHRVKQRDDGGISELLRI